MTTSFEILQGTTGIHLITHEGRLIRAFQKKDEAEGYVRGMLRLDNARWQLKDRK